MLTVAQRMIQEKIDEYDTVIAGGGIAGLVTALELLESGQRVAIIDRDTPQRLGGLARWAFGGMALSGTIQQKRMKIPDSAEVLLKDWFTIANFSEDDHWPRAWATEYATHNTEKVYLWLKNKGLKFLPAVNWVERGLFTSGNSVPRYHILWGTGWQLVETIIAKLMPFVQQNRLFLYHQHKVLSPILADEKVCGVEVENEQTNNIFTLHAQQVVIACGGINGSSERVKENWYKPWGKAPDTFLNGANPISDGKLHDQVQLLGGKLTHLDKMWNYAAGIPHPQPEFDGHGLSLIPCKSALWLDHTGKRIGPVPLVTGFDTHFLCQQVAMQEKPWTWQILNWDIAVKELAVSGSMHNPSIRDKKRFSFLKEILFGNHHLVKQLTAQCPAFVCAGSIEELSVKMNELTDQNYIVAANLANEISHFDDMLRQKPRLQNDDQIRRILHARQWPPDRLRTCKPAGFLSAAQALNTPSNKKEKLIAIKLQLISRKSLGGLQTNLHSEVLNQEGNPIQGLYCVGEAAGFGGGGMHGHKSLEGTFLSACILTARNAAKAIISNKNNKEVISS